MNEHNSLCIIYQTPIDKEKNCSMCKGQIHGRCGIWKTSNDSEPEFQCFLCQRTCDISINCKNAKRGLEVQADLVLAQSNKKFKPVIVGDNVLVRIPDVDCGKLAPRNVMVVVQAVDNGFYKLATKSEVLQKLFCRKEFQLTDNKIFM
ncbi:tc5 transposase dna-binding domain [Holotrichia oblita]|uniref:Tc5 transposase dna-binding domain n=1 Tax=Holotrichia oblita TaxID=644536 RepID=A0ACB9TPB4_HOLOL|nr:tc5 transposase dna-binding domain [Holotrichia oblita]